LLTEATGDEANATPAVAWVGANGRQLVAEANDIIQYSNNYWRVVLELWVLLLDSMLPI
jgi:hypothetical protein